jgi:protein PET100, fungi type
MYLFFPIAFMGYFGVNLDERFAVPDFWPKPEEANKVPTERDEIKAELERLRARRLYLRDKRMAEEAREQAANQLQAPEQMQVPEPQAQPQQEKRGWFW